MNTTKSNNEMIGYLAYAFNRLVIGRFKKYYYLELLIVAIGISFENSWPMLASFIIGFGIGLFFATLAISGLVQERVAYGSGVVVPNDKIEVTIDDVVYKFDPNGNSIRWISDERLAFWCPPKIIFCDLPRSAEPKGRPEGV